MSASAAGPSVSASTSNHTQAPGLLAQGDWTKNLVQLAKTAELKKHALTLQLHTAQILSAHGALDEKNRAMQDLKEQKNKLESERTRLLSCLRQVNEDRDKTDMLEQKLNEEITALQDKVKTLSEGDYAAAKADVDRLRKELGQDPLPGLRTLLEEKTTHYLKELRLHVEAQKPSGKRSAEDAEGQASGKRPRGRPKGSRNSNKKAKTEARDGAVGEGTPGRGSEAA